jgi:CRISPR system Cascade subunit CasE
MPHILTRARIPYDIAAKWQADGRPGFADPYAWHQRSWDCFPGRPDASRDFLTRVDAKDTHLQLLILSPTAPTRPAWCPEDGWASKAITDGFFDHSSYRFALLANPTRKVRSNAKGELLKNSRRVPITHREDCEENDSIQPGLISWLVRHGEQAGFEFDAVKLRTTARPRQAFVRPANGESGRHVGTLHAVDFEGFLNVTDSAALRQAFEKGIGSAKAFGFGMLCLSPL